MKPQQRRRKPTLTDILHDDELFKSVLAYHSQIDEALLGCLVAKYWNALEAAQALYDHILELKKDLPFDLELSIDENPPEVRTCQSLTQRYRTQIFDHRNPAAAAAITHIAPNFGVEKGVDYRCPGGLEELENASAAAIPDRE